MEPDSPEPLRLKVSKVGRPDNKYAEYVEASLLDYSKPPAALGHLSMSEAAFRLMAFGNPNSGQPIGVGSEFEISVKPTSVNPIS